MNTKDLRTKSTNPNASEITQLLKDKSWKEYEIELLKEKLAVARASLSEMEQTLEYLGGRCATCGEFGQIVLDEVGFCQFCH